MVNLVKKITSKPFDLLPIKYLMEVKYYINFRYLQVKIVPHSRHQTFWIRYRHSENNIGRFVKIP